MVTVLLPTLVIVLGIADAVHFPTAFVNELRLAPDDRVGALKAGLMKILVPCFMTTLTTMAGFLALSGAPMAAVRDLGIFAAIGVGAALLASVILMVIAFMALRDDVKLPEFTIINGWLARIISVIEHRPWRVGLFSLILIALTGYGALHLKADTYTLGYLPDDHGVVLDHHEIVDTWGDYFPLEYTVRPVDGVAVDSPKLLNAMEGFVEEASRLNSIRNGLSLATVFRRSQQAFAPDSDLKQPFSGPLVSQLKILTGDPQRAYEWDQEQPAYRDNVFAPLMNREGTLGRMTLVGEMTSAQEAKTALNELDVIAQRHFADLAIVEPAGYPPLYVKIIDYVIASQAQGFYIALGLIFCLMLLWLRSFRLALISLVVNVFPVTIMFGVMFFLGQTLDIASATIAAIVLGVSIDDTIHFMAHWRKSEESNLSWSEAVAYTFEHAGRPAVITTLLLVAGFPILMLAQVKTVFYFGLLTTIAAIAALFADLFILPLLLRLFPARRDAYGGTV